MELGLRDMYRYSKTGKCIVYFRHTNNEALPVLQGGGLEAPARRAPLLAPQLVLANLGRVDRFQRPHPGPCTSPLFISTCIAALWSSVTGTTLLIVPTKGAQVELRSGGVCGAPCRQLRAPRVAAQVRLRLEPNLPATNVI